MNDFVKFLLIKIAFVSSFQVTNGHEIKFSNENTYRSRMKIEVVSGAGSLCLEPCSRWIAMEGRITSDSVGDVVAAITSLSPDPLVVVVNSSGGDLAAALTIGRMLRQFDATVIVGHTIFPPPRTVPGGSTAQASQRPVGVCHSACVYVLAGGRHRLAGEHTRIGVHRPVEVKRFEMEVPTDAPLVLGDEPRPTAQVVRKSPIAEEAPLVMELRRYVTEMGIDDVVVEWSIATSPSNVLVITWSELLRTHLLTSAPLL